MNKILSNMAFMIVAIIVFVVLGNLFLVSKLNAEIKKTEEDIVEQKINLDKIKKELGDLSDEKPIEKNTPKLVSIGQEGQIMKLFLDTPKTKSHISINSYNLYSSYYFKPEDDNKTEEPPVQTSDNSNKDNKAENIPMLDENGMPVNAYTQDEDDWKGIEITPVKITFSAEPKNMYSTLKLLEKIPVNAVRAADFVFKQNLIRATMTLTFPLNEQ
ncbi:MAG: hypothetical protein II961_10035 [Candidatus Riflebacteria bacterium]|nr:hypothetical protein [Candidatus Riflebacteria bacterium]